MSHLGGSALTTLRKSVSWGGARALVQLLCSFVSVKLTAVYLGPGGMALIAQLNSFMTLCQSIVITGLDTATTRLSAEYGANAERQRALLWTVGKVGLGLGLPTAAAVAIASPWLASWILDDSRYAWAIVACSVSMLAAIFNAMLLSALSARGDVGRVVLSNIVGAVCGLLVFAPAAVHWGLAGAVFASSVFYSLSLMVTLVFISRSSQISVRDFVGAIDVTEARRIARFYPMLLVHAVAAPLSLMLIRDHVTRSLSLEAAGLWQACWRVSEAYLMVVMSTVTTQFMVRLGETVNAPDRFRNEVIRTLVLAVGATVACAVGIYIFRGWVVRIIFSPAFEPVTELLPMQLVGDVLRMIGWTLGFVLVATLRSKWYSAIALIVPFSFIAIARMLDGLGVHGVTTAYAISGLVHCALSFVAMRDVFVLRAR